MDENLTFTNPDLAKFLGPFGPGSRPKKLVNEPKIVSISYD
jgi:hypothetical protein